MYAEAKRVRNPEQSRRQLLEAAFQEIYRHGFQGARVDRMLATAGLTKGAFYHHFGSKQELGYSVVEELLHDRVEQTWVAPLREAEDPLSALQAMVQQASGRGEQIVTLGCPVNNLAQEMSPVDEGFRARLNAIYGMWSAALEEAIGRGQQAGQVRADVNPEDMALFLLAALEGCAGMAKNAQSHVVMQRCLGVLHDYLESLRP